MADYNSVLAAEIESYLELKKAVFRPSTIAHEKGHLRHFDQYLCNVRCEDKTISEQIMTGWQRTITGKTITISHKVKTIQRLTEYLNMIGIAAYIPTIPLIRSDYVAYIFSDEEVKEIIALADLMKPMPHEKPDYKDALLYMPMILRILFGCGTRLGETITLKMKNVDLDSGALILTETKRNKQRIVPMHVSLTTIISQYCYARGIIGNPDCYLFGIQSTDGTEKPIPERRVQLRFSRILSTLGIGPTERKWHERGPCLHCCRHSFAIKSFSIAEKNGQKLDDAVPYLSIYLGHENLNETQKYLKFSSEMYPEALQQFSAYTNNIFPEVNYEV